MRKTSGCAAIVMALAVSADLAKADFARVEAVTTREEASGWRFDVTISHPDSGWDHYADGWDVVDADGNRLGFRELLHPHVTEQPFTRSLGGVSIPSGVDEVFIRARCSVDGWGPELTPVSLQ